ncbi:MAG: tryptophan 2,3-dioxygenase family protein [Phycisphaerales bacterium]|nr:tryptophan 2,3-dioxygenase family protein [Phycisphaerales bacterium]
MTSTEKLTYDSYLRITDLLELQQPLSAPEEHDETLFIIIHQVYELWFKQMLHEGDFLCTTFGENDQPTACATLKRMLTILKTMVAQIDVLETMSPVSFQSFRRFLKSSSGFQSAQFREFEFLLGHKRRSPLDNYDENSPLRRKLEGRLAAPSIWDAFCKWLSIRDFDVPQELLDRDVTEAAQPNPELQKQLIAIYHGHPAERTVCELLVDLDEGIQEWRYRHVKMVERTIGTLKGTGGSPGAAYLRNTLFHSLFPDLWAIRSEL